MLQRCDTTMILYYLVVGITTYIKTCIPKLRQKYLFEVFKYF